MDYVDLYSDYLLQCGSGFWEDCLWFLFWAAAGILQFYVGWICGGTFSTCAICAKREE